MDLSRLQFLFNARGFGELLLLGPSGNTVDRYISRTGSIDQNDQLVNALPVDIYRIQTHTETTTESSMWILDSTQGWKARMWKYENGVWVYTHLCIHPDGGKRPGDGTMGCIGLQGVNALSLRREIDNLIDSQKYIPMTVGHLPLVVQEAST